MAVAMRFLRFEVFEFRIPPAMKAPGEPHVITSSQRMHPATTEGRAAYAARLLSPLLTFFSPTLCYSLSASPNSFS